MIYNIIKCHKKAKSGVFILRNEGMENQFLPICNTFIILCKTWAQFFLLRTLFVSENQIPLRMQNCLFQYFFIKFFLQLKFCSSRQFLHSAIALIVTSKVVVHTKIGFINSKILLCSKESPCKAWILGEGRAPLDIRIWSDI